MVSFTPAATEFPVDISTGRFSASGRGGHQKSTIEMGMG